MIRIIKMKECGVSVGCSPSISWIFFFYKIFFFCYFYYYYYYYVLLLCFVDALLALGRRLVRMDTTPVTVRVWDCST